ncbi:MAG: type II toxin-antitoxin system Phd/YefM family antitoxin [Acidobacteria bacterium]|jgi:prevent-host-death family protein|nr:type II toxin-antitoxin system Phd/YefM family antitoxin [Acidobacteriota bacterium]
MTTLKASEARANLYRLIDRAAASHEPVLITGKRSNAILVSEDDWRSIEETLFLLSVPGMRESIVEGMATPLRSCLKELKW